MNLDPVVMQKVKAQPFVLQ